MRYPRIKPEQTDTFKHVYNRVRQLLTATASIHPAADLLAAFSPSSACPLEETGPSPSPADYLPVTYFCLTLSRPT